MFASYWLVRCCFRYLHRRHYHDQQQQQQQYQEHQGKFSLRFEYNLKSRYFMSNDTKYHRS